MNLELFYVWEDARIGTQLRSFLGEGPQPSRTSILISPSQTPQDAQVRVAAVAGGLMAVTSFVYSQSRWLCLSTYQHLRTPPHHQHTQYFHHPSKSPVPPDCHSASSPSPGKHWSSPFCHCRLIGIHPSGFIQYVFFCVWLHSLSVIFLRFIYVVHVSSFFLFIAGQCSIARIRPQFIFHNVLLWMDIWVFSRHGL